MNTELPHLIFRWLHVLAAVMWVGQLWSLVVINRLVAASPVDATLRQVLLRAHNWHRWAATLAWITGIPLLGIVYYAGGALVTPEQSPGLAMGIGFTALFGAVAVYRLIWEFLGRYDTIAAGASLLFLGGAAVWLNRIMTGRAVFIHIGAMLATIMLANVWERIWPIERRRLASQSPQQLTQAQIERAGLHLRHNASLAVAVILFMISNHFPLVYGNSMAWLIAPAIVALGWLVSRLLYVRTGRPAQLHG
jgi:uncharacterized membrane protein